MQTSNDQTQQSKQSGIRHCVMYVLRTKRVQTRMIAGLHLTNTLYLQYNPTFLYSKTKQLLQCIGILFDDQIINHNPPQLSYLGFLLWSLIYNETHVLAGIWRKPPSPAHKKNTIYHLYVCLIEALVPFALFEVCILYFSDGVTNHQQYPVGFF